METAVCISPEEYLVQERLAEYKSEYFDGEVIPMAGASPTHNSITSRLNFMIQSALQNTIFELYQSDMRVCNLLTGTYCYPDLVVVGEQSYYLDEQNDCLLNPLVIVEVLSDSTMTKDREMKFEAYKRLESLQEYMLVEQDRPHIEIYRRTGINTWLYTEFLTTDETAYLATVDAALPLKEIYAKARFNA